MKKLTVCLLLIACVVLMLACSPKPDINYIGDDVTKIDISHSLSGQSTKWSIEGEEIELLREWLSGLECKVHIYVPGNSPGDSEGGEVYRFEMPDGDGVDFSYIINGENTAYLQVDGNWLSVENPTDPPVSEPEDQ